ncbi:MAG: hypothetical protein Kow0010_14340 [Dehalococcoidia bacterium]
MTNDHDERPRLLLLHGFLSGRAAWERVAGVLGDDVGIIALDLLGYGEAPRPEAGYTLEDMIEALVPTIEREAPTHVVGHSMGGIVALALANRFPEVFRGIGVVGLPVYGSREEALAYIQQRGLAYRILLRSDRLAHAGCVTMHRLKPLWLPVAPLVARRHTPALLSSLFDHSEGSHVFGLEDVVFAGRAEQLADRTALPVAALHGTADRSAPLPPVEELARQHGWDLTVVRGAGHQVIVTQPRRTAAWIRRAVLPLDGASRAPSAAHRVH